MRHWKEKRVACMKRRCEHPIAFVFESTLNPGRSLIHIRSRCTRPGPGWDRPLHSVRVCIHEWIISLMQWARNRRETRSSSSLVRLHLRTSLLATSYEYVNVTAMDAMKFLLLTRWKGNNWRGGKEWNGYERISIRNYRLLSLFILHWFFINCFFFFFFFFFFFH